MHNLDGVRLEPMAINLTAGDLQGRGIVHWTGAAKAALTAEQRKALVDFVNGGGTLIIDAAGGSAAFADSVETELKTAFGAAAEKGLAAPLPDDHAIYALCGQCPVMHRRIIWTLRLRASKTGIARRQKTTAAGPFDRVGRGSLAEN